jgi:aspartate oxidase
MFAGAVAVGYNAALYLHTSAFFCPQQYLYTNTVLSPQLCELRNIVAVAYLIIKQSSQRRENRGAFFNADL